MPGLEPGIQITVTDPLDGRVKPGHGENEDIPLPSPSTHVEGESLPREERRKSVIKDS